MRQPGECMRVFWAALAIGLILLWSGWRGAAQGQNREIPDLFEEAQRYHLGDARDVDYRRAFALYQEVVKRDPQHRDAYYNMAHICFAQKRYDLAADFYQRVIRLDPQDADAHNNMGAIYQLQGNATAAKTAFLRALTINRDLSTAYYNLAVLLVKEGDKEKALRAIEQALRLEPDNPDYVRLHAGIHGKFGKFSSWIGVGIMGAFAGVIVGYYFLFGRRGV